MISHLVLEGSPFRFCILCIFLILISLPLVGEGTPDLRTVDGDPVLLFVGNPSFGNFASYGGPEESRLNFRIAEAGETVFLGMSRGYLSSGVPELFGQYEYRIRSAADGSVVFGPIRINADRENLTTYEQAALGPAALVTGGYPTDENSTFVAPAAGEYFVEFDQINPNRPRYIGLWDITVMNTSRVKVDGRVYSRNWAFRVPELEPALPECAFGAELSTVFYSYTTDGFVTMIDFTDSGFQPLSFTLAFNRSGPGQTGNILTDRQSVAEQNATVNVAEHLIFLKAPDPVLFPDGNCGQVMTTGFLNCQADETFCIPLTVTLSGQVEVILDFNSNGVYDEATDRLLAYRFSPEEDLTTCLPWDGLMGDGGRPLDATTVDILVEYTQGVQHWALFDGELMRNGFCVTPVRPICGDVGNTPLYYDDINIPDDPGNGAPKRVLNGCECATNNCRTWTNFEAFANEDCSLDNDNTTGYGDRNTLNTWWFASSLTMASFDVPLSNVQITGPELHCPDETVDVAVSYASTNDIGTVRWTGPAGGIPALNDQLQGQLSESGTYTVRVTDEFGCESSATYNLLDVTCSLNIINLEVLCSDNGTETERSDDTYTVRLRVDGDNSSSFNGNGVTYSYGEEIILGPFPISGGNFTFTATDNEFSCCSETIVITAPLPCSIGCAITSGVIIQTNCIDPNTPTDPSDDLFTFDMSLNGVFLGSGWTNERGDAGNYDEVVTFGPFLIADGPVRLNFTDNDNPECMLLSVVEPPPACSDECILSPEVSNLMCNNQGTPFDTSDDTYTFNLLVTAVNARTPAYSMDGVGTYFYNQTVTVGPFPMQNADYTYLLADLSGNGCEQLLVVDERPTGCEVSCGMDIADSRIVCNDGGTSEAGDDTYSLEILVTNQNPNASGWETEGSIRGGFGTFVRVGSILPGGSDVVITINEEGNTDCSRSVTFTAPVLEVTCPEDVNKIDHLVGYQSFAGELSTTASFLPGSEAVCWIDAPAFTGQRRYTERLTLARTDTTNSELRLFSFYLYGPAGSELRGAVFSQRGEETPDCCQLTNDGPVRSTPTNARSLPTLPDSLTPAGQVLQQRFSVVLRANQTYSLTTSSALNDQLGNYRWVVISADREVLDVRYLRGGVVPTAVRTTPVVFDLLTNEVSNVFGNTDLAEQLGLPLVDGLCGEYNFTFSDDSLSTCDRAQITRSFDLNVGDATLDEVCRQLIEFRNLGLMDISWPEHQIRFGCQDTFPHLANDHPAPAFTGYPFVYRNGLAVRLPLGRMTDLFTSFEDQEIVRPEDGGTTILRTWTVQDLCRETLQRYVQTIKLDNNGLPFFSCPISNHFCPIVEEDIMLWAVENDRCTADIEIPQPELNNICDSANWLFLTEILTIEDNGDTTLFRRLEMTDERLLTEVPLGDYLLRFIGQHPTATIADRFCRIRVADLSDPVMVCKANTNLSLPGSGMIRVPISVINQFSYDNCGIDTLQIRRYNQDSTSWTAWHDAFAFFDCADVGTVVAVEVRGIDSSGNANFCTSRVRILDNTDPYCTGLETQFISCDDLPTNFDLTDTMQLRLLFGMPEVIDNCSAMAIEFPPIISGEGCSPERIRRRFQAIDQHGNLSTGFFVQDIHIMPTRNYAIRFPMDVSTDCTDFNDTLRIVGGGCDSITVRILDIMLPVEGTECRHVQRNYVVTNWCEWDGVSESIRIGRDENCNGTEGEAEVWLISREGVLYVDTDDEFDNDMPAAGTVCGDNPAGYLRNIDVAAGGRYVYQQQFKVFDTTAPELAITMLDSICVDTVFCRAPITAGITILDACQVTGNVLTIGIDYNNNGNVETTSLEFGELTGVFPNYAYTADLPIGEHRYVFTVTDDCGNTSVTERVFRVNDCYVPVLYCRSDRIYNLQPLLEEGDIDNDGVVEEAAALVEATDLARCEFLDCSGNLTYSVNRVGEPYNINQSSIFLDCEDRYEVYLELYVWDAAFTPFAVQPDGSVGGRNWRRCIVKVRVQDPSLVCNACQVDDNITINGRINTLRGAPLEGVTVRGGTAGHTVTNRFGGYQLGGTVGDSYVLSAEKDVDPRAGLSTIDLLILQRHLLGLAPFTNPFVRLAADVNRDGQVDLGDLITLQALILARRELYPTGSPWRFVSALWDGTGNPEEEIVLSELLDCGFDHDFIGLRVGDLNDSFGADAGAANGGRSNDFTSARPVSLEVQDRKISAGEVFSLPVTIAGLPDFAGGQAAVRWDGTALRHLDQKSDQLSSNRNFRLGSDYLWVSWSDDLVADELLAIEFLALKDGKISDFIILASDDGFSDEIYDRQLTAHPLFLTWNTFNSEVGVTEASEAGELFGGKVSELLGVLPNPARSFTTVGVYLGQEQSVHLMVTDFTGRRLISHQQRLGSGEQWLRIDVQTLPAGVYPFTLQTINGLLTGRIVRQ